MARKSKGPRVQEISRGQGVEKRVWVASFEGGTARGSTKGEEKKTVSIGDQMYRDASGSLVHGKDQRGGEGEMNEETCGKHRDPSPKEYSQ